MKTKTFLTGIVILALAVGMIGCEAEVDEDWTGFAPSSLHNFENPPTPNHGDYMAHADYPFDECAECHGTGWQGVNLEDGEGVQRSCYTCHKSAPHAGGDLRGSAALGHADHMLESGYDFDACFTCHTHYPNSSERTFASSCASSICHDTGGPDIYECNNCHGDRYADPDVLNNSAPPQGLAGNDAVGAHQAHLDAGGTFAAVPCASCHIVPLAWNAEGHLDGDNTAEVDLRLIADDEWVYNEGETPAWSADDGSCSATYCHGQQTPVWSQAGSGGGCNTCHDLPPETAYHSGVSYPDDCSTCHGAVIDGAGMIIDGTKHVNGTVDRN